MIGIAIGFVIGLIIGHIIYRRYFMKKRFKHRTTIVTHIIYLGERIKLDYPITFYETY
jgi:uncharacterized membrane-anchored protein YhcB (DUF1043 family)